MAEQSAQERTEQATPKKRQDSRKKGQVPRSKELSTLISLLAAGAVMLVMGGGMVNEISQLFTSTLSFGHEQAFDRAAIFSRLGDTVAAFLVILAPMFILLFVSVFVSPLVMGGFVMNLGLLAPKLERISPAKGLGRIFSPKGLMELVKAIGKFLLVGAVAVFVVSLVLEDLFTLPMAPVEQALGGVGALLSWSFMAFSSALILIAVLDVPFQMWDHSKQLRMTKQEIRDEMKDTEGKPEVKSQIRQRQQQMAQQRMMTEVPKADVVITNPTHFAVALRYDQQGGGAPRVVAKGRDLVAARIREIAAEHDVPVFSAPPLARALYATTDLNAEIPANLFAAVAQVLAYIFQLKRAPVTGRKPVPPKDLPVPDEFKKTGAV